MPRSKHLLDLPRRPRRLRASAASLDMIREIRLAPDDFILPLFVHEDSSDPVEIAAMPGVERQPIDLLLETCQRCLDSGIRAVALFPVIANTLKNADGDEALNPDNLLHRTVRAVKRDFPSLLVVTDVALDPYTTHGHDGLLDPTGSWVENDATVDLLTRMAVLQAEAGSDWVAPSDMMDGRVGAIRRHLDGNGHTGTAILAYSAKFRSAFYGPFREAVGSSRPSGDGYLDKSGYQLDPANRREALTEAALDEAEGADILMVKPAGAYLDIIREVRDQTRLPVAAYQVSGEYAMIRAAAGAGWIDYTTARDEALIAIRRAGADLILSYFALEWAENFRDS